MPPTKQFKNKQRRNSKYRRELKRNSTEAEDIMASKLDEIGFNYIEQKGFIKGKNHIIVDFYIPSPYKICIEVDGKYHNTKKQKKRDINKEKYIRNRRMEIFRISNERVEAIPNKLLFRLLTSKMKKPNSTKKIKYKE